MQYAERWLMLLALGLYVYDSALLLYANQAVVIRDRRGWRAVFGLRNWTIAGREPYFPNPFTGHRPSYLVQWSMFDTDASVLGTTPINDLLDFSILRACVMISTLCLFVFLPLGLFTRAGSWLTIMTMVLITLNNLVALAVVSQRREQFGLSVMKFVHLAVECLLCPPFSLNLIRRVCAAQKHDEALESIAARLFEASDRASSRVQCLERIEDALEVVDEGSTERIALMAKRSSLLAQEARP